MVLDGVRYNYFDDGLIQWQKDAIDGEEMDAHGDAVGL